MKIIADYHVHSKFCHGKKNMTILEVAKAAKERGLKECAIVGHGFSHLGMKGLRRKEIAVMRKQVAAAEKEVGIRVLLGIEANVIGKDGKLDVSHEEQKWFDIVLAGLHLGTYFGTSRILAFGIKKNTEIMKNALRTNDIDILVHPGRGMAVDVVELAKVCKETNTYFEINSSSGKFDDGDLELCKATGVEFVIGSDAHKLERVGEFSKAIKMAKEAGITPVNVNSTIKLKRKSS